jgi:hypothetical protein
MLAGHMLSRQTPFERPIQRDAHIDQKISRLSCEVAYAQLFIQLRADPHSNDLIIVQRISAGALHCAS